MELKSINTRGYPQMAAARDRVEPAPRRVWAVAGDQLIFDTTQATYVWETPFYPQYYIPESIDIDREQRHSDEDQPRNHAGWASVVGRVLLPAIWVLVWSRAGGSRA